MGALTVFLLDHHSVTDGQQTPELPHRLVRAAPNGSQELRVPVRELPVGKFVPEVGVPLRGWEGTGRLWVGPCSPPPLSRAAGRPGLTLHGAASSSSGPGERPSFRPQPPRPRGSRSAHPPTGRLPGATGDGQTSGPGPLDPTPQQPRTPPGHSFAFCTKERKEWHGFQRSQQHGRGGAQPHAGVLFDLFTVSFHNLDLPAYVERLG